MNELDDEENPLLKVSKFSYFIFVYFQVKGLMKINSPPVLLGYEPSRTTISFGPTGGAQQRQSSKCETYLQLFVTIEPQLQPAQPLAEKV